MTFADGLDELGKEQGVGSAGGIGLAAKVAVGNQLLEAVKGGIDDLENAGGGGVDERAEDDLGLGERVLGGSTVVKGARKGGSRIRVSERGGIVGGSEAQDEGFALVSELGVFAPGRVLNDLVKRRDHYSG